MFLNGVQVGFVLMIENNIPFTAEHLAAMSDVSRAISSVVGHYHPELFQYTSADQQLLEALLIGTPADILAESISHLRVSDAMYALCIQPKTFLKENELKQQLYPVIRHIFPEAYMTVHDNALVLLVPDQSSVIFVDTQKVMLKTIAEYHLDVGISWFFQKWMNFTELISRRGQFLNGITESLITLRRKYHGIKGIRWSIKFIGILKLSSTK